MRAQDLMTTPVVTLSPEMSVKEAATILIANRITGAPVVDREGRPVGMVTAADLLRGRLLPDPRRHLSVTDTESAPLAHEVAEVMSSPVQALPVGSDLADVGRLMTNQRVRLVPLVDGGRLAGILTRRDLLRLVALDDAAVRNEVRTAVAASTEDRPWVVDVAEGSVRLRGGTGDPALATAQAGTVPGVARVSVEETESRSAPRDHAGLRVFSFAECIIRLRSVKVGRVAFLDGSDIVVLPVNHAIDGSAVVFRTAEGAKLFAADTGSTVSFQVDGYESVRTSGWSVLLKGHAARVYDDDTLRRLDRLDLVPWADAEERPVWIRITPTEVTGREIVR